MKAVAAGDGTITSLQLDQTVALRTQLRTRGSGCLRPPSTQVALGRITPASTGARVSGSQPTVLSITVDVERVTPVQVPADPFPPELAVAT